MDTGKNSNTTRQTIIMLVWMAVCAVIGIGASVWPESASADPARTLPHDHSSRGRGGSEIAPVCLTEATNPGNCVITPSPFGADINDGSGSNPFLFFKTEDGVTTNGEISATTTDFSIDNLVNNTPVIISADDIVGTRKVLIRCWASLSGCTFYVDGNLRGTVDNNGYNLLGATSGSSTGTNTILLDFQNASGVEVGEIGFGGFTANNDFHITNSHQDGDVQLRATDNTPTVFDLWSGNAVNRMINEEGGGRFYAIKTADQSVTNSTTFVDDTHLALTSVPVGNYSFEMSMRMSGASADDIKFNFSSAGDTIVGLQIVGCTWISDDGTMSQDAANLQSTTLIAQTIGGSNITVTTCTGIYEVQTAGDVQMQWAQNVASVVAGTIYEGSWLRMEKYGN